MGRRPFARALLLSLLLFIPGILVPLTRYSSSVSLQQLSVDDERAAILPVLTPMTGRVENRNLSFLNDTFDEKELEDSFSACLMVMDDNHRLIEWVAYHYHVLKLRYMVIAVDPRSKTSPRDVLDRWNPYMEIHIWEDERFMPMGHYVRLPDNSTMEEKTYLHRRRQSYFLSYCSHAMWEANRTYVTMVDSDEYIVFHEPKQAHKIINSTREVSLEEPGSVLRVLHEARSLSPQSEYAASCMPILRIYYNSKESSDEERQMDIPAGYNATNFDTLRFLYRSNDLIPTTKGGGVQIGKNIVDVSRINPGHLTKVWANFNGPHQILYPRYCFNVHDLQKHTNLLRVNHYLGSWESYSVRDDARNSADWRSRKFWEETTSNMSDKLDDVVRPWLNGFVQTQGKEKAEHLLRGAGIISPIPHSAGMNDHVNTTLRP